MLDADRLKFAWVAYTKQTFQPGIGITSRLEFGKAVDLLSMIFIPFDSSLGFE